MTMQETAGYEDDFEGEGAEGDEALEGAPAQFDAPDDFETVSQDVDGYWDPVKSGPIIWTPRAVRLLDNSQGGNKSSCLIFGELADECLLQKNVQNRDKKAPKVYETFPKGTSVGVWGKAGMRDLLDLGGAIVWMAPNGFREVPGREKPMALFLCKRKKGGPAGEKLGLVSDVRQKSLIEPLSEDSPPWWLKVLDDGGEAKAQAAMNDRAARKRRPGGSN